MSFFLYTNEQTEEGIDLGDPLRLLSSFKEMATLAGEESKNYPELFGVPLSGEQEVLPDWLAKVGQQAQAFNERFGGRLSEYTKGTLALLSPARTRVGMESDSGTTDYGPYQVRRVNGERLRDTNKTALEFTNFGVANNFPGLIPSGEIWISDEVNPAEEQFFLDNAVAQLEAVKRGKSPAQAYLMGVRKERAERRKASGLIQSKNRRDVPPDVRVRQIGVVRSSGEAPRFEPSS